ncbi:retrotransposon ORF1 [Tanacetum coccineum]
MFVEIIKKYNDSSEEELEEDESAVTGELGIEYFDRFLTRSELAYHMYLMCAPILSLFLRNPIIVGGCPLNLKIPCNLGHVHIEKAYIDLNSPINVMTRMQYNWIIREQLEPRKDPVGIRGIRIGRFANGTDEISYKMPHKIEQFNSLSDLEKEHTKSVYFRNEEDKRRGVEYVMNKILGFYKEYLELGPRYLMGLEEGKVILFVEEIAEIAYETIKVEATLVSILHPIILDHISCKRRCEASSPDKGDRRLLFTNSRVGDLGSGVGQRRVTVIEESKDLSTLPLDELIGNLKVYEGSCSEGLRGSKIKKEKNTNLPCSNRQGKYHTEESLSAILTNAKRNIRKVKEEKKGKEERRCFKCGDPNHFISDCPKYFFDDQKAFVGGCWMDPALCRGTPNSQNVERMTRSKIKYAQTYEWEFIMISSLTYEASNGGQYALKSGRYSLVKPVVKFLKTALPESIRVICFSIYNDDGNPSSIIIKQHCGRTSYALRWKYCQGGSSKLNLPDHSIKTITAKFSNSANHELPHHQRSSKSNQESSSGKIINVLDSSCLLVLFTGTSQSRQHDKSESDKSRKSPTAVLFDVDTGRISIHHYSISTLLLFGDRRLERIASLFNINDLEMRKPIEAC